MKAPERPGAANVEWKLGLKRGTLATGETVFDRQTSHIASALELERWLPAALVRIEATGEDFIERAVSFDTEIGKSICVTTTPDDEIVYAQRPNRGGYTRFVKNREPEPTNELSVALKKVPEGYIIVTAYIGPKAPPEPWDAHAEGSAHKFWSEHALIWGAAPIVPGTERPAIE